jgi:hypothetical protein
MGTPGSGRYTTYVPVKNDKTTLLSKLFKGGLSSLYSGKEKNTEAAAAARDLAISVLDGKGDPDMFGAGVNLVFNAKDNADTTTVKWSAAGDPANPYVPDITSPGPGKTDPKEKDQDPGIAATDIKPSFDTKNPTPNTASPASTSTRLGTFSLGENLEYGKSSKV